MAKGGKRVPRPARTELDALREYANSLAPQKGFFSTLDELVQQAPFERAPVNQWRGYLQPGRMLKRDEAQFPLKGEEVDYALNNVLGPREADDVNFPSVIEKAELLDIIRQNRPQFALRQNYQMPAGSGEPTTEQIAKLVGPGISERGGFAWSGSSGQVHTPKGTRLQIGLPSYGPEHPVGERLSHQSPGSRYEESATRMRGVNWRSHQFPNDTISWGRTSTHQLPSGEKMRLIEEIQSDLHAQARDRMPNQEWRDYLTDEERGSYTAREKSIQGLNEQYVDLHRKLRERPPRGAEHLADQWQRELEVLANELKARHDERYQQMLEVSERIPLRGYRTPEDLAAYNRIPSHLERDWTPEEAALVKRVESAVPDAPFKETQEYAALEMRKQLLNAVNNDEDYLALTTGQDQIDRYRGEDYMEEGSPEAAGMRNAYDRLYRSAMEKLARRYGAEVTEVEAPVGSRKDTRPAIMRQLDAENLNDFFNEVEAADSWHDRMNWLKELPYQLGLTGQEGLDTLKIARRIADLQEEIRLDDASLGPMIHRSGQRLDWYKGKTAALEDAWDEYKRRIGPLMESRVAESQPTVKKFPALRLTPEVRERVKRLGVPLWSVVGGTVMFNDETEGAEFAEGGSVRSRLDDLGLAFKLMNPGTTEVIQNLGDAARHFPQGYRTQWMGLDKTGRPRGALYHDWEAPKDEWEWNSEAQMALPPQRGVRPGIVDDTIALPAYFGFGPQASFDAAERAGALEDALREEYDVPPPESWGDFLGESGGIMGAQVPLPSGLAKGALGRLGRFVPGWLKSGAEAVRRVPGVKTAEAVAGAVPEFMLPTIEPSLQNYALGTGAGAALMKYLPMLLEEESPEGGFDPEDDLSDLIDWEDPNLEVIIQEGLDSGDISPEDAERFLSEIEVQRARLKPPPIGGTGMAKGGRVRLTPVQLEAASKLIEEGHSIADIAEALGVNYPALYKRLTRAGVAQVQPIVRNEMTPEARREALNRALAGENQYKIADDLGVTQSAVNQLKKRAGEIEGMAKGGRVPPDLKVVEGGRKPEQLVSPEGKIETREERLRRRLNEIIHSGDEVDILPPELKTPQEIDDWLSKHAKGGRVKPPSVSGSDLRKQLDDLVAKVHGGPRKIAYMFPRYTTPLEGFTEEEYLSRVVAPLKQSIADAGLDPAVFDELEPMHSYGMDLEGDESLDVWKLEGPSEVVDQLLKHGIASDSLEGLRNVLPETPETASYWDEIRNEFSPKRGHAKGGRVRPPTDKLALRQRIAELMSEAQVASDKQMVPTDPLPNETNLPAPDDFVLPENLPPPPDTNLPKPHGTVSRREVLQGMRDLAGATLSPVDPTALLDVDLSNLGKVVEAAPVAKAARMFELPQLAHALQLIYDNISEGSEDSAEILANLAREAAESPQLARVAPFLQKVADLENRVATDQLDWESDEYMLGWDEARAQINSALEQIARDEGVIHLPEEYEDFGDVESGPRAPTMTRPAQFVEPPVPNVKADVQSLINDIRSGKVLIDEGLDREEQAAALERWLEAMGPRVDAEFIGHYLPDTRGSEWFTQEKFDEFGVDETMQDYLDDFIYEPLAEHHANIGYWADATPEQRVEYRRVMEDLQKMPWRSGRLAPEHREAWEKLQNRRNQLLDDMYGKWDEDEGMRLGPNYFPSGPEDLE